MTLAQRYEKITVEIENSDQYLQWCNALENLIEESESGLDLGCINAYLLVGLYMSSESLEFAYKDLQNMFQN